MKSAAEAVGLLLLTGYLFYDKAALGLIFFPYILIYMKKSMERYDKKAREKLAAAFRDGMQAVVAALTAGYSAENAFRESLFELELLYGRKSDIYAGFARIVNKLNLNVNIEEAFADFARESGVEEITAFAQVLEYAKQSGGNLIAIIRDATESISEKIEVKREISTIISAKKLEQNIMNLVPMGIILYMRVSSAEMFDKLYKSAAGIAIMSVCLAVYCAAKIIADRIVDIKV
ncbi:MAG: hypothetical protein NC223_00570 [Butyrivibrio sp.]|nr:hypothetical protein [Butyrivibrio sp.]